MVQSVSVEQLEIMAAKASGMSHRYTVQPMQNRCVLEYSNPNEWGIWRPYRISFPMARQTVYLDPIHTTGGGDHDDEIYESVRFAVLEQSPPIKRPDGTYSTHAEWCAAHGVKADPCQIISESMAAVLLRAVMNGEPIETVRASLVQYAKEADSGYKG
jgi:hypothetical protein